MTALTIFGLLAVLLLTGMPVSIALGLTVFGLRRSASPPIPMDSIALKLFTGIEKFEIMAIPFFILAGNFLTHGGVARRMIRFASSMVGHWYGGMGLAAVLACALFAAISGSSPATVMAVGSILIPAMVKQGYPTTVRHRHRRHLGRPRHPDPALDRDGHVFRRHHGHGGHRPRWRPGHGRVDRHDVHGRHRARPDAGDHARPHDDLAGLAATSIRAWTARTLARTLRAHSATASGA